MMEETRSEIQNPSKTVLQWTKEQKWEGTGSESPLAGPWALNCLLLRCMVATRGLALLDQVGHTTTSEMLCYGINPIVLEREFK